MRTNFLAMLESGCAMLLALGPEVCSSLRRLPCFVDQTHIQYTRSRLCEYVCVVCTFVHMYEAIARRWNGVAPQCERSLMRILTKRCEISRGPATVSHLHMHVCVCLCLHTCRDCEGQTHWKASTITQYGYNVYFCVRRCPCPCPRPCLCYVSVSLAVFIFTCAGTATAKALNSETLSPFPPKLNPTRSLTLPTPPPRPPG